MDLTPRLSLRQVKGEPLPMYSPSKRCVHWRGYLFFVLYPIIQIQNSIFNLYCSKMSFQCLKMHLKQIMSVFFRNIGVLIIVIENDFVGCTTVRYYFLYFFKINYEGTVGSCKVSLIKHGFHVLKRFIRYIFFLVRMNNPFSLDGFNEQNLFGVY
ncbi:MAG: hypothetical protein HPY66_3577 [Firmicutes bacterium]|nr:hypothetical protein [Bacillota bacterium]